MTTDPFRLSLLASWTLLLMTGVMPADAAQPMRSRAPLPVTAPVVPPPPTLTFQPPLPQPPPPPDAEGTSNYALNREVVRRVIYVHVNQIRYCYQQALLRQPKLAGRLSLHFEITPAGQVQDLFIGETSMQAPELMQCISDTVQSWAFPPTPYYAGVVRVIYPFVLRPKVPEPPSGIEVSDDELAALGIQKDPEPPAVDILF